MRAILLTSTFRRHVFVANTAAASCELVGVWQEQKTFRPETYARDAGDDEVIERHFVARDRSEEQYFSSADAVRVNRGALHRVVAAGACSDPAEVALMTAARPDVVLVFGTGILREPLLAAFGGRIINIHLGLSPYYRGAGTNFWPLVNGEPEYVGATIHYLDAGIDTGPIMSHARPSIERTDGPHDIGNKTIVAAVRAQADAAIALGAGGVKGIEQSGDGRVYKRADFSAAAVRRLYANFEAGMIGQYLRNKAARDAALSLVTMAEQRVS